MASQICKVTGIEFQLTADESEWYTRFSLPMPELLREERFRRKLAFLNTHRFFWRKSENNERIFSAFSPQAPFAVEPLATWKQNDFRKMHFDFTTRKPFFEQLYEAWKNFPRPEVLLIDSENTVACNHGSQLKNCRSVSDSSTCESCHYSVGLEACKNCVDCLFCTRSSACYECVDVHDSSELKWCSHSQNCLRSSFLTNCFDCTDCLFCTDLQGKQYCVLNKQLSAEDYAQAVRQYDLSTRPGLEEGRNRFGELTQKSSLPSFIGSIDAPEDLTGNFLWDSTAISNSFEVSRASRVFGGFWMVDAKECLDGVSALTGVRSSSQFVSIGGGAENVQNVLYCWKNVSDVQYSAYCSDSRHLFGCFGLSGREYCIGNQQYSESEYKTVLAQILEWLRAKRVLGKFFPSGFSDVPYNHSAAQDYFPLNKYQAELLSFRWEEGEDSLRPSQLLQGAKDRMVELPARSSELDRDKIAHQVFLCEWSGMPYQIVPQELEFYLSMNVPPPAKCFEERHRERIAALSPLKVNEIKCAESAISVQSAFPQSARRKICARKVWRERVLADARQQEQKR